MKRKLFLIMVLLFITNSLSGAYLFFVMQDRDVLKQEVSRIQNNNKRLEDINRELQYEITELKNKTLLPLEQDSQKQQELKKAVQEITGFSFKEDVPFNVLSKEELAKFLESETQKEYPPDYFKKYQKIYARLGVLPEDYDLEKSTKELLGEQVAGLYDLDTKKMYLVSDSSSGLAESEKEIIVAHELTHALRDQQFPGFEKLDQKFEDAEQDDALTALHALMEGDATYAMVLYGFQHPFGLVSAGTAELFRGFFSGMPVFDQAPDFLKRSLLFPYEEGTAFVQYYQLTGGKEGVNRLFQKPPLSTEHILHPEKYDSDFPQTVSFDLGELSSTWKKVVSISLGEFETRLWLSQFLDEEQASAAAEGWDGDRATLLERGGKRVLLMGSVFDSAAEFDEFRATFEKKYLPKRFPSFKELDGVYQVGDNRFISTEQVGENELMIVDADNSEDIISFFNDVKLNTQEITELPK